MTPIESAILELVRPPSGQPLCPAEIVHDLTALRATVRHDLPQITPAVVEAAIKSLVDQNAVTWRKGGDVTFVPAKPLPTQKSLF